MSYIKVAHVLSCRLEPAAIYIYVGRSTSYGYASTKISNLLDFSVLGNPFQMDEDGSRTEVCEKYDVWLNKKVREKGSVMRAEFSRLWKLWRKADEDDIDVILVCWCAPKRCHASSIEALIHETDRLANVQLGPKMCTIARDSESSIVDIPCYECSYGRICGKKKVEEDGEPTPDEIKYGGMAVYANWVILNPDLYDEEEVRIAEHNARLTRYLWETFS